ncbi:MAG: hypothetical protein ABF415_02980 [Leuconostoc pseudomesenteroides]|uniref:hypothetical protein n=1 Tax=Leuconostoc pseudomesenteroides TaxID=33968 RepID=UPI0039EC6A81
MIGERKFWFSTFSLIIFITFFYLFSMSWEALSYDDWLSLEVLNGGNYFQNWSWQVVFSIVFLLYWVVNYEVPVQQMIRLETCQQVSHMLMTRIFTISGVFGFIYWSIPFFRIMMYEPTSKQFVLFSFFWSCQVFISVYWEVLVIQIILIVHTYLQKNILFTGLSLLIAIVLLLHIWPMNQSLFADTQVTAMIRNNNYQSGLVRFTCTVVLMAVLSTFFRLVIEQNIWRLECKK